MSQLSFFVVPFLAYVLVASPATYKVVRGGLGNWVANAEGRATFPGLLLHALVFVLLVGFLMRIIPRASGYGGPGKGPYFENGTLKKTICVRDDQCERQCLNNVCT